MDDPLAGLDSWENATPKQSEDPLAGLAKWEDPRPDKFRDQDRREQGAREWAVKTGGGDAPIDQVMRGIGFENANKTGPFGIRPRDLTMPFQGAVTALGRAITGKDSEAELMKKADDAYEKGDATDEQLARRAIREYEQNRNQQIGPSGRIAQGVAGSGAVLGEALVGGAAVKAAGAAAGIGEAATGIGRMAQAAGTQALATPLTPSMWLKDAEERQAENGGALLSPKNAGLPMIRAAFTNAIMGHLGKVGEGKGILKQIAIGAGGMPTEMAAADTLAGFGEDMFVKAGMDAKLKTSTGYGTIGMLAEGKYGPAMEKIAVEAILGGMNSVFHGKETKPLESFKEAVDHLESAGIPADTAGKVLQDAISKPPEDLHKSPVKDFVESMKPEEPVKSPQESNKAPVEPNAEAKPEPAQPAAEGEKAPVAKPVEVDPVKEAVQKAVGDRIEDIGGGVYTVSHGDRFIAVSPAGENRVTLNFDSNSATDNSTTRAPKLGLASGTKNLMVDIAKIAKELAHTGKEIEYTASPVKGEGGRSSRADLYGRMLEKAGYEQIEKKDNTYVWKPKPETVEKGQIQNGIHPAQVETKGDYQALIAAGESPQAAAEIIRLGQKAGFQESKSRPAPDAKGTPPVETPPRKGLGKRPVNPPSAPPGNDVNEGSRPGEKASQSQTEDVNSIKNEFTDAERERLGMPPRPELDPIGHSFPELRKQVLDTIESDPGKTTRLFEELSKKSRPISDIEDALLLHKEVELRNENAKARNRLNEAKARGDIVAIAEAENAASDAYQKVAQMIKVSEDTGAANGRGLNARKMLAKNDFTLENIKYEWEKSGGKLDAKGVAKAESIYEKIKAAKEKGDIAVKNARRERVEKVDAEEPAKDRSSKAKKEVDSAWDDLRKLTKGRLFSNPVDPQLLIATAKLTKAYIKLGVAKLSDFIAEVRKRSANPLTKEAEDLLNQGWVAAQHDLAVERRDKATARLNGVDPKDTAKIGSVAKKLYKDFAQSGLSGMDERIDAVHKELKKVIPDITRDQAMDAISGYGVYRQLSKGELEAQIRDQKGQMQQLGKLRDMAEKEPPKKTGFEQREPSAVEKELIQKVNDKKKELGYTVSDPATQLKSILESAKTRMKSQIDSLSRQIENGKLDTKSKAPKPTDAELESLTARRDKVKEEFDVAFGTKEMTDAKRLEIATESARRSYHEYDRRIKEKDFSKTQLGRKVTSPELEAMKAHRDAIREEYHTLRDAEPAIQAEANAKSISDAIKRTQDSIADYEKRIEAGDLSAKGKPKGPTSPELESARAKRDELVKQLDALRQHARPKKSPEEIGNQRLKTYYAKKTAELQGRLAAGDFSSPAKKTFARSPEANKADAEFRTALSEYRQALAQNERANESLGKKFISLVGNALDLQRNLKLGGDLPPIFRQAGLIMLSRPWMTLKSLKGSIRSAVSEHQAQRVLAEVASRENAKNGEYKRNMGLDVSDTHGQDEFLRSSWVKDLPIFKPLKYINTRPTKWLSEVRGVPGFSHLERAHSTFLTRVRADYYDALTAGLWSKSGHTEAGKAIIGNAVNVFSGRGGLAEMGKSIGVLNKIFLAPNWVLSRFKAAVGEPIWHGPLKYGFQPRARAAIATEYLRQAAGLTTVYGLISGAIAYKLLPTTTIEWDPRSSDFGEIRIGNTRINPMAGLSQVYRLFAGLYTSQHKAVDSGHITDVRIRDTLANEFRKKLAPVPGTAWTAKELRDKDKGIGKGPPIPYAQRWKDLAQDAIEPLTSEDFRKAAADLGLAPGIAVGLLASFGAGVKIYDKK